MPSTKTRTIRRGGFGAAASRLAHASPVRENFVDLEAFAVLAGD